MGYKIAARITDKITEYHQHRHHHRDSQKPRHYQILYRTCGHDTQRVNLLRHFHGPQFRRNRCADTACNHNPCQDGYQFPPHGNGYDSAYGSGSPQGYKLFSRLYREHHAGTQHGQEDNRQRIRTQKSHLTQHLLNADFSDF